MALDNLENILAQLRKETLDTAPIGAVSDRIELLAADELKKIKATDDAGKLAVLVKDWHASCKSSRLQYEKVWYKNLDMYQGRQFTEWSLQFSQMVETPIPNFEPRIAINIVEPVCRTEMAKTSTSHPSASVSPASNDDSDVMAALAGQHVWDWFYDYSNFQGQIFSPANFWRTICGNGFIKTWMNHAVVDEAATEAAERESQQQAELAEAQQLGLPPEPVAPVQGKITADPVSPFHLFVPDLSEPNIQKQGYVLHSYAMPVERAKIAYKDYTPKDWKPSLIPASSVMNTAHLGIQGGNRSVLDSVLVIEAWIKPGVTTLMPEGGLVITVADEIVAMANEGIPYKHGEFPFAHLTAIDSGGFYRKSVVESIVDLQNELNRTYAQIIKSKNMTTKPAFFYPEGAVDPRRILSRAGQYIPIRLGMGNPVPVPMQALPQYVLDLIDRIKSHLDDITGQHQISRAISPGANTASSALALLQETDDNFLSTTFDSITAAMQTVARQYLSLVVQFWDVPRMIKVTGEAESFDTRILTKADVANGTDIRIDSESMLPKSKSGRVATITDWIAKGIIEPDVGLEAMEMGTLGKIYERIKLDADAAKRENLDMRDIDMNELAQWNQQQEQQAALQQAEQQLTSISDPAIGLNGPGAPTMPAMPARQSGPAAVVQPGAMQPGAPGELVGSSVPAPPQPAPEIFFPINWYDNDPVHMKEHRAHANTQAYQQYPPEIKKVFEDHYYAHMTRSLNLQALGAERSSAQAAQEAAELAQQAPSVQQTARVGGKDQYAGQQFTPAAA